MRQHDNEVTKFHELIRSDIEIIALREKIQNNLENQLENGTITAIDYLTIVNAVDQAKQNLLLRQIQILMAQYNNQTTT